jgi:hypothetical protein
VQAWDGGSNKLSAGTFTHETTGNAPNYADALEVIYPISPPTPVFAVTGSNPPTQITVYDVAGQVPVVAGDLVLIGDNVNGVVMTVTSVATATNKVINLGTPTGGFQKPSALAAIDPTCVLYRVSAVSVYLDSTAGSPTKGSLMLDPNGVAGTDHTDAQPLAENVDDFQVSVGVDTNNDGIINETPTTPDEWVGNVAGELAAMASPPWSAAAQPRLLRISLAVKTGNTYVGASTPMAGAATGGMAGLEDHAAYTAPASAPAYPRWRAERITVAPRAWVLGN